MNNNFRLNRSVHGFSLVEMAIVLVILAFVLAALLLPLQAQRNLLFQSQTENTLELAKRALLGYVQANGRLPCPAVLASSGMEQPLGGGACVQQGIGFLPAATLGVQPVDSEGFALDGWGNRIRYAVTLSDVNAFVTPNGMSGIGMSTLAPDLRVCASSVGITATACSVAVPEANYLTNNAVAVIYSIGATGFQAVGGTDETANLNDADADGVIDDGVFVSHEPRSAADPNGEFDHIVTWISPYVLYNAMIEAGQLH